MSVLRRIVVPAVAVLVLVLGVTPGATAATIFGDDFEDGDSTGWSGAGGTWSVATDDTLALRQSGTSANAYRMTGQPTWSSYTVQARVKPYTFSVDAYIGLLARACSPTKYYRLAVSGVNEVRLEAVNGNSVTVLDTATYPIGTVVWYTIAIEVDGTTIRGVIDGNVVVEATSTVSSAGQIGVQTVFATASFDDFLVTSGTSVR